jgi:hypothetical protein
LTSEAQVFRGKRVLFGRRAYSPPPSRRHQGPFRAHHAPRNLPQRLRTAPRKQGQQSHGHCHRASNRGPSSVVGEEAARGRPREDPQGGRRTALPSPEMPSPAPDVPPPDPPEPLPRRIRLDQRWRRGRDDGGDAEGGVGARFERFLHRPGGASHPCFFRRCRGGGPPAVV